MIIGILKPDSGKITIYEFEGELAENQIEELVDEGIYIKVYFGIKQSGLIFIPNYQLDILEEENQTKYKIFIRETTSYFVYNKEHSDKNQYVKRRTLIRQLTNDSRVIPYRRHTVKSLQEKITEINLFIDLKSEDVSSRKLVRYDFSKLNLPESITADQVIEEIRLLQGEVSQSLSEYDGLHKNS